MATLLTATDTEVSPTLRRPTARPSRWRWNRGDRQSVGRPFPYGVGAFPDLRSRYGELRWLIGQGLSAQAPALPALTDADSITASLPTSPPAKPSSRASWSRPRQTRLFTVPTWQPMIAAASS